MGEPGFKTRQSALHCPTKEREEGTGVGGKKREVPLGGDVLALIVEGKVLRGESGEHSGSREGVPPSIACALGSWGPVLNKGVTWACLF